MLDHAAALCVTGCEITRSEWQPLDLSASRFGVRATVNVLGMVPSMPMMRTLLVSGAETNHCVPTRRPSAQTNPFIPDHGTNWQRYGTQKRNLKRDRSNGDWPLVIRSATASPMAAENLKP